MQVIAIVNEKGGTAKTTTAVNLAACLGQRGRRVLLVDLDGQAAASRWMGVEEDARLADALIAGGGLKPIENVSPGVDLAPACGKIDSVAHDLRPTQGGQLRKVLGELKDRYDHVLIDCPPSLGNRLIGNALLAATHALVPVETSILALDGLRILLTMLGDIRDGFGHTIRLMGVLPCRYDARTRLSRLVLAEMQRGLPGYVFDTVIRANVRLQEAPAAQKSILEYAADSTAAADYLALADEMLSGHADHPGESVAVDEGAYAELDEADRRTLQDFRSRAAAELERKNANRPQPRSESAPSIDEIESESEVNLECEVELECEAGPEAEPCEAEREVCEREIAESVSPPPALGDLIEHAAEDEEAPIRRVDRQRKRMQRAASFAASAGLVLVAAIGWFVVQQMTGPPRSATAYVIQPGKDPSVTNQPSPMIDQPVVPEMPAAPMTEPVGPDAALLDGEPTELLEPEAGPSSLDDSVEPIEPIDWAAARNPQPIEQINDLLGTTGVDFTAAPVDPEPVASASDPAAESESETESAAQPAATTIFGGQQINDWRVTATMVSDSGGMAILNGQAVRAGQSYRGATLLRVHADHIILEHQGQSYRMSIGKEPMPIDR